MMGLFRRKAGAPRVQSIGEMVAYSLDSEVTRGGWIRGEDGTLANEALGVTIPRSIWFGAGITVRNKKVPLDHHNECEIDRARERWIKWEEEARRAEAMVAFVDAFEKCVESNP